MVQVTKNIGVSSTPSVPPLKEDQKAPVVDIEHVFVQDDPREWPRRRKLFTLITIASAALIATLGINIYNPAINDIKAELHATDQQISLTLSIFILVQGIIPLVWSAISEILGRKPVYLVSIVLYVIGCAVAATAKSIGVLIAMRIMQAIGGSAVLTVGAATLADIYEPRERGTVVGIYYAAPLLGPSLGPLIGGVATQLFSWRANFYFLVIFAALSLCTFIFFKDTFRRERSLSYQIALRRRMNTRQENTLGIKERNFGSQSPASHILDEKTDSLSSTDIEANIEPQLQDIRLGFKEINPIRPLIAVFRRINYLTILIPSSMIFGFSYCITYTVVITLGNAPYNYDSLKLGLVLLSFGIGNMAGSLIGGRWSDHVMRKCKAENGGRSSSEDRLKSTKPMILVLPAFLVAYAWMAEKKVNVAGLCVALFFIGFSSIWIYSSTLAYIVDANVGRSSTAVASNSFVRGAAGFVAAEIAVPLQDALGDGGLYTLWAGIMLLASISIWITIKKGAQWRESADEREKRKSEES
ncbi:hypothetical protein M422DRAFT_153520 [Sphaerobolus stellatus SS14]|nr:hypothetical protein M422DRAFT_153520 [Sphaerobolus stellatus SS14]